MRSDRHSAVDETQLDGVEREIGEMILQLGLQGQDFESFSWQKAVEATQVNVNKALQVRNVVQEISGHTHKTNTQTNTLQGQDFESFSWQKAVEATQVNVNKALQV